MPPSVQSTRVTLALVAICGVVATLCSLVALSTDRWLTASEVPQKSVRKGSSSNVRPARGLSLGLYSNCQSGGGCSHSINSLLPLQDKENCSGKSADVMIMASIALAFLCGGALSSLFASLFALYLAGFGAGADQKELSERAMRAADNADKRREDDVTVEAVVSVGEKNTTTVVVRSVSIPRSRIAGWRPQKRKGEEVGDGENSMNEGDDENVFECTQAMSLAIFPLFLFSAVAFAVTMGVWTGLTSSVLNCDWSVGLCETLVARSSVFNSTTPTASDLSAAIINCGSGAAFVLCAAAIALSGFAALMLVFVRNCDFCPRAEEEEEKKEGAVAAAASAVAAVKPAAPADGRTQQHLGPRRKDDPSHQYRNVDDVYDDEDVNRETLRATNNNSSITPTPFRNVSFKQQQQQQPYQKQFSSSSFDPPSAVAVGQHGSEENQQQQQQQQQSGIIKSRRPRHQAYALAAEHFVTQQAALQAHAEFLASLIVQARIFETERRHRENIESVQKELRSEWVMLGAGTKNKNASAAAAAAATSAGARHWANTTSHGFAKPKPALQVVDVKSDIHRLMKQFVSTTTAAAAAMWSSTGHSNENNNNNNNNNNTIVSHSQLFPPPSAPETEDDEDPTLQQQQSFMLLPQQTRSANGGNKKPPLTAPPSKSSSNNAHNSVGNDVFAPQRESQSLVAERAALANDPLIDLRSDGGSLSSAAASGRVDAMLAPIPATFAAAAATTPSLLQPSSSSLYARRQSPKFTHNGFVPQLSFLVTPVKDRIPDAAAAVVPVPIMAPLSPREQQHPQSQQQQLQKNASAAISPAAATTTTKSSFTSEMSKRQTSSRFAPSSSISRPDTARPPPPPPPAGANDDLNVHRDDDDDESTLTDTTVASSSVASSPARGRSSNPGRIVKIRRDEIEPSGQDDDDEDEDEGNVAIVAGKQMQAQRNNDVAKVRQQQQQQQLPRQKISPPLLTPRDLAATLKDEQSSSSAATAALPSSKPSTSGEATRISPIQRKERPIFSTVPEYTATSTTATATLDSNSNKRSPSKVVGSSSRFASSAYSSSSRIAQQQQQPQVSSGGIAPIATPMLPTQEQQQQRQYHHLVMSPRSAAGGSASLLVAAEEQRQQQQQPRKKLFVDPKVTDAFSLVAGATSTTSVPVPGAAAAAAATTASFTSGTGGQQNPNSRPTSRPRSFQEYWSSEAVRNRLSAHSQQHLQPLVLSNPGTPAKPAFRESRAGAGAGTGAADVSVLATGGITLTPRRY